MQRLCVTLCGLLSSCLCCWGSTGSLFVSQSPSKVMLRYGEQIQITCCWNISNNRTKVKWFKESRTVKVNQSDKFTKTVTDICDTLVINNADKNDAGFYICEVTQDVPQLVKVNGTGAHVTYKRESGSVTCTTQPNSTTALKMAAESSVPLAASVSGAVVILFICVCLSVWRMKRSCGQSERRVIREGPPSEGEEPGNSEDGGSSRTSRGSTQWYMVPVYESYFDLQKSDDQECADSDTTACASALKS